MLYFKDRSEDEIKSTLLHEIQHAIQEIEGFAKGGTPETVNEDVQKLRDAFNYWVRGYGIEEQQKLVKDNGLDKHVPLYSKEGLTNYRALAGEVESRNVQTRMDFTPEMRRSQLLGETEDVARRDQIVLFQAAKANNLEEIGDSEFGKVYENNNGTTLNEQLKIADFLIQFEDGFVKGVFKGVNKHSKSEFNVGLCWGHNGLGLCKIINKHIIAHDDFDSVEAALHSIQIVLENGNWSNIVDDKIEVRNGKYLVILKKSENGQFVISDYDTTRSLKKKERSIKEQEKLHKEIFRQSRISFNQPGGTLSPANAVKFSISQSDGLSTFFQTAYHGSSATFDEFDLSYGFSGEGSMSFGYGVYVSGSEDIARDYAERQRKNSLNKESVNPYEKDTLEYEMFEDLRQDSFKFNKRLYKKYLEKEVQNIKNDPDNPYQDFKANEKLAILDNLDLAEDFGKTSLYTVNIPDNGFIKWDEILNKKEIDDIARQLPLFMRNVLKNGEFGNEYTEAQLEEFSNDYERRLKRAYELDPQLNGGDLYYRLWFYYIKPHVGENKIMAQKLASSFLNSIGYAGIDYPAGTNYGNGKDARNYVIFTEKDARIVHHIQFQTETELMDHARTFKNWMDFMEFYEAGIIEDRGAVPEDATAQWYQNTWEIANNINPTTQERDEEARREYFDNGRMDTDPITKDSIFNNELKNRKGMLDAFLNQLNEVMKLDTSHLMRVHMNWPIVLSLLSLLFSS